MGMGKVEMSVRAAVQGATREQDNPRLDAICLSDKATCNLGKRRASQLWVRVCNKKDRHYPSTHKLLSAPCSPVSPVSMLKLSRSATTLRE